MFLFNWKCFICLLNKAWVRLPVGTEMEPDGGNVRKNTDILENVYVLNIMELKFILELENKNDNDNGNCLL